MERLALIGDHCILLPRYQQDPTPPAPPRSRGRRPMTALEYVARVYAVLCTRDWAALPCRPICTGPPACSVQRDSWHHNNPVSQRMPVGGAWVDKWVGKVEGTLYQEWWRHLAFDQALGPLSKHLELKGLWDRELERWERKRRARQTDRQTDRRQAGRQTVRDRGARSGGLEIWGEGEKAGRG